MQKSKFFEPLAIAVAAGSSILAAADASGCASQTAYNLSCGPDFRLRVSELRSEITMQAVGRLAAGAGDAVDTLQSLLGEAYEPSIRLGASKAILAALPTMADAFELRSRIDAV